MCCYSNPAKEKPLSLSYFTVWAPRLLQVSIRNPECLVSNNQTLLAAINLGLSSFSHLSFSVFILSISPSLSLSVLNQLREKAIEICVVKGSP